MTPLKYLFLLMIMSWANGAKISKGGNGTMTKSRTDSEEGSEEVSMSRSDSKGSKGKGENNCLKPVRSKTKCRPKSLKSLKSVFFNSSSCECEETVMCLKGANKFDEEKCDAVCEQLVGAGLLEWSDWAIDFVNGQEVRTRECIESQSNPCACFGEPELNQTRPCSGSNCEPNVTSWELTSCVGCRDIICTIMRTCYPHPDYPESCDGVKVQDNITRLVPDYLDCDFVLGIDDIHVLDIQSCRGYSANFHCTWRFNTRNGTIKVFINDVQTSSCNDTIDFYDGSSEDQTTHIARVCGDVSGRVLQTTGPALTAVLSTDNISTVNEMFSITFLHMP